MTEKNIVAELQKKLTDHAEQIGKILTTLHMLKEYDDSIEIPDINSLISLGTKESNVRGNKTIRPDEFYQMSNTEAAEKYLNKIGHAVPLEEIFEALKKGGIKFSANGRNVLNVQLTRATKKFAKMSHGDTVNFGLLDWYPKRKRSQETEKEKSFAEITQEQQEQIEEEKGKGPTDANQ